MRTVYALVLAVLLAAGCGTSETTEPSPPERPAGRDCLGQWNSQANADNRARLVKAGFEVGGISEWIAEAGGDGEAGESTGCSYLFHDDEQHVSFSGRWEGDRLDWDPKQTQTGSWSPEQEAGGYSSSHLVAADGTVRPDPSWAPPSQEELAGPLASAPRGGRGEPVDLAGPGRPPYGPLEELVLTGDVEAMPPGCSPRDAVGLLDHFFAAFNRGDSAALERFFGPDFQYYVHPRNFVEQPATRDELVPFLLERRTSGEQMQLLAVKADVLRGDDQLVELDVALAFRTPDTLAPHWIGALVNCRAQTIVNVGYRSYDLDLAVPEILPHASCPRRPPEGHVVACATVTDVEARTDL